MPTDFAPHNMTAGSSPSPYVASASSDYSGGYQAWLAFDGSPTSYWIGDQSGVDWIKIDLGSGNANQLASYDIKVNSIPEPNRAPKDWTLEGSSDNSTWDTLDTVTGETGWASGETRSFTCDVSTTAYRYFRLNITANNGDANYLQVAELYLFESSGLTLSPAPASFVYSPGTGALGFSGAFSLTPARAVFTYTPGTPSINPDDNISLTPAPASFAYSPGTPAVSFAGAISLAPASARFAYRTFSPGASLVQSAATGTQLIIGGVSYGTWLANTFHRDEDVGATYSASVQMRYLSGSKPAVLQEVALFVDGVKCFGGYVKSIAETAIPGDPLESNLSLTLTGYGSLLDRIVAIKLYTIPIGALASIIAYDLWYEHLRPLGVTYDNSAPSVGVQPVLFHYRTLRDCFAALLDQGAPGYTAWIDNNKALKVSSTGGYGPAAPFELNRASLLVEKSADAINVNTSSDGFRNHEFVLPSADLVALRTETFTGDGATLAFPTVYALTSPPIITIAGVAQTVDEYSNPTGANAYYINGGVGVFFHSPPAAAAAGSIKYPSPWQVAMEAKDDASIAAVGPYDHVTQAQNVTDTDTGDSLAQAKLDLFGPGGDLPQSIDYSYNSAQQSAWLEPGMVQTVNWTFPDVSGDFTVRKVSSEEYDFQLWRHRVTLAKGSMDVTGVTDVQTLLQSALRRSNVNHPHVMTMEVVVDTDLETGLQIDFGRLKGSGVLASWDARDPDNPGGGAWLIDVLKQGVSILPATQINIPDGSTDEQSGFRFVSDNLPYLDGELLTMNVISAAALTPRRKLVVHVNLKPSLAVGAG